MTDINGQTFTMLTTSLNDIKQGQENVQARMEDYYKAVHDRITDEGNKMNKRMAKQEVWRNRAMGFMTAITLVIIPIIGWIVQFEWKQ